MNLLGLNGNNRSRSLRRLRYRLGTGSVGQGTRIDRSLAARSALTRLLLRAAFLGLGSLVERIAGNSRRRNDAVGVQTGYLGAIFG